MSPRIALITGTFPDYNDEGALYASQLSKALTQQGNEVHVITSAREDIRASLGKVNVHKIIKTWSPLDLNRLIKTFMEIRPEIIHLLYPTEFASRPTALLTPLLPETNRLTWRLPFVTTLMKLPKLSGLARMKLEPLVSGSNVVIASNEYQKNILEEMTLPYQARRPRIEVLQQGTEVKEPVSPTLKKAGRRQWELNEDDFIIGFVGALTETSGLDELITSSQKFLKENSKAKIFAIGTWNQSPPSFRLDILSKIEKLELGSKIIFTGALEEDETFEALGACDFIAATSSAPLSQYIPLEIRHALAMGIPVLATNTVQSYSEFGLKHGENIWFTWALEESLNYFSQNPQILVQLQAGALRNRAEWRLDTATNAINRIYVNLLS